MDGKMKKTRNPINKVIALLLAVTLLCTTSSVSALAAKSVDVLESSYGRSVDEADAKSMHLDYSFGVPRFEPSTYGYNVLLDDSMGINAVGMPDLPSKTISFLIPQGKTVDSVRINGESVQVFENILVSPVLEYSKITEVTDETVSDNDLEDIGATSEESQPEPAKETGEAEELGNAGVAEELENSVTPEEATEEPGNAGAPEEAAEVLESEVKKKEVVAKELSSTIDFLNSDYYNHSVYSGKTSYPNTSDVKGTVHTVRGFKIYTLTLYPMEYSGTTLKYTSKMSVDITFKKDKSKIDYYPTEEDLEFLGNDVDTTKYADTYFTKTSLSKASETGKTIAGSGKIDYIIITDKSLVKTFNELAKYKQSKGLTTAVVTTQKIYKKYKGYDKAEKIRNFIKDAYENNKVTYILLGGDGDNKTNSKQAVVPTRQLYCKAVSSGEKPTYIASDVYYSCLEGTYDNNKNHKYGERKDGVGGEDVDLKADVYVGRAPVDNKQEAKNFITKTIEYETRTKSKQALMIGENLDGNIECSAEIAAKLQNEMDADTLTDALRRLRDEKIKAEYVELYYDANDFMKQLYLSDLELLAKTASLFAEYMPIVNEYLTTGTTSKTLAAEDVLCLQQYSDELATSIAGSGITYAKKQQLIDELADFSEYVSACEKQTYAEMFENSRYYKTGDEKASANSFEKLGTTYGGNYKDEIRFGANTNNMTTKGFPKSYTVDTLYDRDSVTGSWTTEEVLEKLNASPELINHLGHSNVDVVMRLDIEQIKGLTNENAFFFYSQGCYAGSFDNRKEDNKYTKEDSIAEELLVSSAKGGAFACVVNTRYGWYNSDPTSTNGPSQLYDRLFWDEALYAKDKSLGKILANSRETSEVINNMNHDTYGAVMRYCFYELTLLGDPETKLHDFKDPLLEQTQLKVKKTKSKSTLSWSAVSGATKYQIYRSTSKNGTYQKIATTKKKKYTDKNLEKGQTYYYKVAAYKKSGSKKYLRFSEPK